MRTVRLAWLLRRATDRRASLIGAGAYALVSALLLITLGGAYAFTQWGDDDMAGTYRMLAAVALVLLVIPLAYLGAAAARLSARAQNRRLSTLRLVGATGPQVAGVTVLGAAFEALLGVLAGAVGAAALTPVVGLIPFRGQPLGSAMWLPWWVVAWVALGVVALAALSSVAGLRRVLVTPLGVRSRAVVPVPSWIRVVSALVLIVGGLAITQASSLIGEVWGSIGVFASILGVFAAGLVALNALGPWVLRVWGGRRVLRAKTPSALLAARVVLDDPAATWRQVSGAAMAGFVAVIGGVGAAMMAPNIGASGAEERMLATDVLTGVILTLAITFAGVASTTLVSQAATVLDREELGKSLAAMGVPESVPRRARLAALMRPLVVVLLLAVAVSGGLLFPLVGMAAIVSPLTLLTTAIVCVAGVLAVWGAAVLAGRVEGVSRVEERIA